MTKWEYRTDRFDSSMFNSASMITMLNQRGAEGWELVSLLNTSAVQGAATTVIAVFIVGPDGT